MKDDKIEMQIQEFYKSKSLTPDQLRELRDTLDHAAPEGMPTHRRRIAVPLAMAAMLALAFGAGLIVDRLAASNTGAIAQSTTMVAHATEATTPPIIALRLHADWCRPSQEMAPRCAQLVQEFGRKNVLFVDLDVTDEVTAAQSKSLARALGVLEVWTEVGAQSGELVIIDRRAGQTVEQFTIENDYATMSIALTRMLAVSATVGGDD